MTPRPYQYSRSGFTAMELLVALGLSTIVAVAAMSVFAMLPASEERLSQRFDDRLDFLITQDVVRGAMDSLVAARPLSAEEIEAMRNEAIALAEQIDAGEDDDEDDDEGDESDDDLGDEEFEDDDSSPTGAPAPTPESSGLDDEALRVLAELYLANDRDPAVLDDLIVQSSLSGPPNFELHFIRNQYDRVLPRLELVLHDSPVNLGAEQREVERENQLPNGIPVAGRIRGAFELVEFDDKLLLMWQPIDPPGLGTVIKEDIALFSPWGMAGAEWWVLPKRGDGAADSWNEVHACYLERDYPLAVRLVMWTNSGEHVDWLFQAQASTPTTRR